MKPFTVSWTYTVNSSDYSEEQIAEAMAVIKREQLENSGEEYEPDYYLPVLLGEHFAKKHLESHLDDLFEALPVVERGVEE